MTENPFEKIMELEIKIKNMTEDINDLCFLIDECLSVLKYYSTQPNGHLATELTRYITEGGH